MKTAVHRVELLIIDHDGCGADGVRVTLESTRYPNRCIHPRVMGVETREVEWSDEHPLNRFESMEAAYRALFRDERRVETGPLQVGDDWPGVFIRGDEALALASHLAATRIDVQTDETKLQYQLRNNALRDLIALLRTCDITRSTRPELRRVEFKR